MKMVDYRKVLIRGNIVCEHSGKGMKDVIIDIFGTNLSNNFQEKTSKYGLFLFELDNSQVGKITIEHPNYYPFQHIIPKGLKRVYIPVLLKPKR